MKKLIINTLFILFLIINQKIFFIIEFFYIKSNKTMQI